MSIREYDEKIHRDGVRGCVIELQDTERLLDARLPPGCDIADEYLPQMLDRCSSSHGKILVAEVDGGVAGYTTVFCRVSSEELAEKGIEYGLVADLVVTREFRGQGIGRDLLAAAEDFARTQKVRWLRVGTLAANHAARDLYASMGFSSLYVELEKDLTRPRDEV